MSEEASKKILIILSHTGGGGDTQVVYNLLYALGDSPFVFHLLTPQRGGLHHGFAGFGKVLTFPIDDTNWPRRILRRFFLPLYKILKEWYGSYLIGKIDPDLVYVNTVNEHEFSRAAVGSGRKMIVHIHEMGFVVTQRMRADWVAALLSRAEVVVSPAVAVSDFYQNVFGTDMSRMRVVHETVSDERLRGQITDLDFRRKLNAEPGTLLIGAVGSVIYRKGVDTLLSACAILKKQLPHGKFLVLWLGGDAKTLAAQPYYLALQKSLRREGLEEHFVFLPHSAEVGDFYAQLDIFALPSRMEAFPLVVLEALLAQKPVVAMDVAGVREVIDAETGYLVKDRTPEGLAEGIRYFMDDEDRRRQAGRNGRQRVLENYEAKVQVKKWRQILETT